MIKDADEYKCIGKFEDEKGKKKIKINNKEKNKK